jgi:c-di-GMP-binding flagellar brake protein YcgR
MKDISFCGVAFTVKNRNLEDQIKKDEILENLIIRPKKNKFFYLKLEIKRFNYFEIENNTFVAGRFIDLNGIQKRNMELFVSGLERENIRYEKERKY